MEFSWKSPFWARTIDSTETVVILLAAGEVSMKTEKLLEKHLN